MDSMVADISIQGRLIGQQHPVYIIAELSGNHHGSLQRAKELIYAAKQAGADAVKLQTYTADTITLDSDMPDFQIRANSSWDGTTLYKLYEQSATPWNWTPELKQAAEKLQMHLFSSPFDPTAVDYLEEVGVDAYKVASFELVDIPLLRYIATKGKPMLLSTGMATISEISEAVQAVRDVGMHKIILLKCTSGYPSDPADMNLNTLPVMLQAFGVTVGLSDHTTSTGVCAAAVALGAKVVEKHITLSRADKGPESGFALEPDEFQTMVKTVREVEKAIGCVHFGPTASDQASKQFRRSLYVTKDIQQGQMFSSENVRSVRPSGGLHPRNYNYILGRKASRDLAKGTAMKWEYVQ